MQHKVIMLTFLKKIEKILNKKAKNKSRRLLLCKQQCVYI